MTNKEKILEIAKNNKGIILTSQVSEANIPSEPLTRLVKDRIIFPIQRGIYVTSEGYVDDFYLLQARFPKGVYSHETAFYLQGYSERSPILLTMIFKYGTSTIRMKGILKPVIVSSDFELGEMVRS